MKEIFNALGFQVAETRRSIVDKELTMSLINNPDGSVRWIWPTRQTQPLFLKFYNKQSVKSRVLFTLFRLVFKFHLQSFVFKKKTFFLEQNSLQEMDFDLQSDWALFTGTPGPNNKLIVYFEEHGVGSFLKIACTPRTRELVEKETNTLNRLGSYDLQNLVVPSIVHASSGLLCQAELAGQQKRSGKLTMVHFNALIELNDLTAFKMPLIEINSWQNIKHDLATLSNSNDLRLPKGMIRKLNRLIGEINEYADVEICLCHGDFTPWNMFVEKDLLYVYDWELADPMRPIGFDVFHFFIQQGILVDRKNWRQIRLDIDQHINSESFNVLSKFKTADPETYLKLYFIFNTVYYLKLYSVQKEWHTQVFWLLEVWNEALSTLLSDMISHRELVLIDTFDFLVNKNYAAFKFQNQYPERVGLFSDVDLCIEKKAALELSIYLKQHPLVLNMREDRKSFMHTLQLFFADGQLLCLDLIWKIKRRNIELIEASSFLKHAKVNTFGVKTPQVLADARQIGLFYTFNNAAIPPKYTHYEELLSKSDEVLDRLLYPHYLENGASAKYLRAFIKKQPQNRGLRGLGNLFWFLVDSLLTFKLRSGFVVTFSGVDGAGKSTVIEKLKYRLEKQMRRRVVVLRHRPSLLPILSVWTQGKKSAETIASNNLPRLGTNNSLFSSLLRFVYYYSDYLIGQFIVYGKYVSRGYIVLYDRYYFDFMHDSKRSNIVLPARILKGGFRFLIKPDLNFFLYADPKTILARKQEIDEKTISRLNRSYLEQFEQLGANQNAKYIPIHNINLDETLGIVMNALNKRAA
jgi:thymidylate kinase